MAATTTGQIARAIQRVRQMVDDPETNAKFSDATIVQLLSESWSEVIGDLFAASDHPPLSRFTLTPVASQQYYYLPSSVGEILRVAERDGTTGLVKTEITPRNELSPWGPGIRFHGPHRVELTPIPTADWRVDSWEVLYIPNGDVSLVAGTTAALDSNSTSTAIRLNLSSSTYGTPDQRPNAYVGCYIALVAASDLPAGYSQFPIQERIISAYDVATGTVTVDVPFDFDIGSVLAGDTVNYEIFPFEAPIVWRVIATYTARNIAGFENKTGRFKTLNQMYAEAKRACILRWTNFQTRNSQGFDVRTVDNDLYMGRTI
jgi:hypothetical protein